LTQKEVSLTARKKSKPIQKFLPTRMVDQGTLLDPIKAHQRHYAWIPALLSSHAASQTAKTGVTVEHPLDAPLPPIVRPKTTARAGVALPA
jgi:hypothetical protein